MPTSRTPVTRLLCAAITLAAPALYAQEVTLKVSHFLPPNSNYQKGVLEPWCDKLAKESGGKLKCQIYPAMQLGGTPPQLADQVKNAVADIVMTSPSYSSGRFPYTEALEQPFTLPPGGLAGSKAMWEYSQKYAMKDYADFKLLAMFSGSGVIMSTSSKPILTVDGFKGVKLRSPSRSAAKLLTALGGAPVNMPPAQITEAVAKGVVDGAMATWELVPAVKLQEVTKYHMQAPANQEAFTQNPLVMLMNKAKYDGLPADLKAVLDKASGPALVELAGTAWDKAIVDGRRIASDAGNKTLTVKPEDYAAMRKASATVEVEWAREVAPKGLDGAMLVKEVRAIGAKHMK
ncbi:MAG: TRAP transporter substrate-binding protein [Sphaerotilus sp.]|nr:TRAP transporter substrate-binding protein [Sphaerotilus sp.]